MPAPAVALYLHEVLACILMLSSDDRDQGCCGQVTNVWHVLTHYRIWQRN